jgi:lipooligosaccharide transport system permease protein
MTAVPAGSRAVWLVVEGLWTWYRRNWRATAVNSFLQPLLFLLALGFGFGTLVQPGPATGGLDYVHYLAPALLVAAAVQNAVGDSTYPVFSGFKWQKQYWGITATPISPGQVAAGQLTWITIRLALSGLVYLLVAAALGALTSPRVLLALPFAVLAGLALSAPIVAYAASVPNESPFQNLYRFLVVPMTLLAGTYFPVDQLPLWGRVIAWITPLWHGTELARGVSFGWWQPWPAIAHTAYLLVWAVGGIALARWRFRVRLAV